MSLAGKLLKKGKWFKPNLKLIQKKMIELQKKKRNWWKPRDGRNIVRFLPAATKTGMWYYDIAFHYGPGLPCLAGRSPKGCPVCKLRQKLLNSSSKSKQKLAKDISPQIRVLFNIVDLTDDAGKERGVQVYAHTDTTLSKLMTFWNDPEWGDFTDPVEGYDVIIEKTNEKGPNAYKIRPRRNPSKLAKMSWLKNMKKLSKVHKIPTYMEAKRRLYEWKTGDSGVGKFKKEAEKVQSRYED